MNIPIQSVIFSGLRGVGKTVLINKLKDKMKIRTGEKKINLYESKTYIIITKATNPYSDYGLVA